MPKTARNRNALHDVLAQGASNRDITVYTKIRIDISKHVEKSLENFEKSKTRETIAKIPKKLLKIVTYVKRYTAGHLCTKFEEFSFVYEAMIEKKNSLAYFWL